MNFTYWERKAISDFEHTANIQAKKLSSNQGWRKFLAVFNNFQNGLQNAHGKAILELNTRQSIGSEEKFPLVKMKTIKVGMWHHVQLSSTY